MWMLTLVTLAFGVLFSLACALCAWRVQAQDWLASASHDAPTLEEIAEVMAADSGRIHACIGRCSVGGRIVLAKSAQHKLDAMVRFAGVGPIACHSQDLWTCDLALSEVACDAMLLNGCAVSRYDRKVKIASARQRLQGLARHTPVADRSATSKQTAIATRVVAIAC